MSSKAVFTVYAIASGGWLLFLVVLTLSLRQGLHALFSEVSDNRRTAVLLARMVQLALFLIGAGYVVGQRYSTGENTNWLTLTWNVADQFEAMALSVTLLLVIFALTFLVLYIIGKRLGVIGK